VDRFQNAPCDESREDRAQEKSNERDAQKLPREVCPFLIVGDDSVRLLDHEIVHPIDDERQVFEELIFLFLQPFHVFGPSGRLTRVHVRQELECHILKGFMILRDHLKLGLDPRKLDGIVNIAHLGQCARCQRTHRIDFLSRLLTQ